jgi:hypothetical protein
MRRSRPLAAQSSEGESPTREAASKCSLNTASNGRRVAGLKAPELEPVLAAVEEQSQRDDRPGEVDGIPSYLTTHFPS